MEKFLVRETNPNVLQYRIAELRKIRNGLYIDQQFQQDLNNIDQFQSELPVETSTTESNVNTWFSAKKDQLEVLLCQLVHKPREYVRGEYHSICPTCKRKYALPWADEKYLDRGVYILSNNQPQTGKTYQVVCKHGTQTPA